MKLSLVSAWIKILTFNVLKTFRHSIVLMLVILVGGGVESGCQFVRSVIDSLWPRLREDGPARQAHSAFFTGSSRPHFSCPSLV